MLTNALAPDKLGGLERYVRELAAALVKEGRDVTVLTKKVDADHAGVEIGDDGVCIVRHDVPSKRNPAFAVLYPYVVASAVRRELARRPDALVHGHYAITTLPVAYGKRPYLYTFHAPVHKEVLSERQGSYVLPPFAQRGAVASVRAIEARVVSHADKIVTLSSFMADEVAALSSAAQARTQLIPGGIDVNHFAPLDETRTPWANGAAPLLFTARRFTARTGVQQLVEAMADVVVRHPRARLAIAGDGRLRPDVEARVRELGLSSSVNLLGRVSDDELRHWYRVADLTVMPTQDLEGFGLTTAESMACGTPAIVTPVGANAELVHDVDPLLVMSGAQPSAMAESIDKLLSSGDRLHQLRSAVRAHAVDNWGWKAVAEKYCGLYDEMAQHS